jgi:hypothetical protein
MYTESFSAVPEIIRVRVFGFPSVNESSADAIVLSAEGT